MLRIELDKHEGALTMRIEGRFVNRFAEEARELILRLDVPPHLMVNLSDVSCVDATGESVLLWLNQIGAQFIAKNCYSLNVCERLHLRTVHKGVVLVQTSTTVL